MARSLIAVSDGVKRALGVLHLPVPGTVHRMTLYFESEFTNLNKLHADCEGPVLVIDARSAATWVLDMQDFLRDTDEELTVDDVARLTAIANWPVPLSEWDYVDRKAVQPLHLRGSSIL